MNFFKRSKAPATPRIQTIRSKTSMVGGGYRLLVITGDSEHAEAIARRILGKHAERAYSTMTADVFTLSSKDRRTKKDRWI